MPTKPWTLNGEDVEVDFTIHKAVPATRDTPGVIAYIDIEEVREEGRPLDNDEADLFMDEEYHAFQANVLKGEG